MFSSVNTDMKMIKIKNKAMEVQLCTSLCSVAGATNGSAGKKFGGWDVCAVTEPPTA